jgi:iron complex transport system ATP-binding protein
VTAVRLAEVSLAYDGVTVVHGLSLEVPTGSWVGLLGPNGAGKTTVLRAIAGLIPHTGAIAIEGEPISAMSRRRLARAIAYVPQRPVLPKGMTVTDHVLAGRTPYIPHLGTETRRDVEVARLAIERLELGGLAGRTLDSLSGGEAQRAVLARALAQQAPVLVLDEPTAALDVGHQQQVLELLDELRVEQRLTVISSMHDLTLAGQFAEDLVLLDGGRAVAWGPARAVLTESRIRRHYGATVRVLDGPDGGVLVLPTRPGRRASETAEGAPA